MKGGEFVLLGENTTQHNGGNSISVGANVYSAGGRLYFVHTFAGGDFIPVYCLRGGDFLWGGSITQHRRWRWLTAGAGIQWHNVRQPINEDNRFSMVDVYLLLSINVCVHSLVFWYLDGLFPGDFGMPKPIYFPFTVAVPRASLARFLVAQ